MNRLQWYEVRLTLPPRDTPIMLFARGKIYQGEMCREHPTWEETFEAYDYFIDVEEYCDFEWFDVTHWAEMPELPEIK